MNNSSEYDDEYSAVLKAPQCKEDLCPSCDNKADTYLCNKCRDSYICDYCSDMGVCKECHITCLICLEKRIRGDFLTDLCESCENNISSLEGIIYDFEELPYKTLIDIINQEVEGTFVTNETVDEETREYLTSHYIKIVEKNG